MKEKIQKLLFEKQDLKYKEFQISLIPGSSSDTMIGVRTPELRKLAKELAKDENINDFLNVLPHTFYDEMNLHGFILCEEKDYEKCIQEIDRFLPFVDNWATCDLLSPKAFKQKKNRDKLLINIQRWLSSTEPFTIRFGIEMLMSFYLDENFKPEFLSWVARETEEHYYVKMMVAWYMATALAKQWDATIPVLEKQVLPKWTHNKAIQKAIESYRITSEQKDYLRTLKMK